MQNYITLDRPSKFTIEKKKRLRPKMNQISHLLSTLLLPSICPEIPPTPCLCTAIAPLPQTLLWNPSSIPTFAPWFLLFPPPPMPLNSSSTLTFALPVLFSLLCLILGSDAPHQRETLLLLLLVAVGPKLLRHGLHSTLNLVVCVRRFEVFVRRRF